MNARRLFNVGAILLFAAFCYGLGRLLVLRYAVGDAFPVYSSLRADPLGTKVFYESLRALPDLEISRNERPLQWLGTGEGRTMLLLGTRAGEISDRQRDALERFVQSGGRLVLTLHPTYETGQRKRPSPSPTASPSATPRQAPEATPAGASITDMLKRWDIELKHEGKEDDAPTSRTADLPLEESVSWRSRVVLQPQHPDWRVIYESSRGPAIVERTFGNGSVVLASDSYFTSNEALLTARAPALLAWLVGANRTVIFDESHLDVREQPGVATLLRRYGLSGFVLGFIGLVVLWLWRNATYTLVPRATPARADEAVSGRDSFSGLVQLLRRGIAPAQLVAVCIAEWKKSGAAADRLAAAQEAAAANKDPVSAYNEISARVGSKKWKTTPAS